MSAEVCGHALPAALVAELDRGTWTRRAAGPRVAAVFGEEPSRSAAFYSLDEIRGETGRWARETDEAYLGRGEESLDPAASVLIGDLGYDRPFALDYRVQPPAVRLLSLAGTWVRISDSIESLIRELGDPPEEPAGG
ncbi:MAG TPA: hypothetical protein VH418_03885 [Solirubrobacteraceae bacterium]|jgi:hypothetical protein